MRKKIKVCIKVHNTVFKSAFEKVKLNKSYSVRTNLPPFFPLSAFPEDGKIRFKKPVAKKRTVEGSDSNEGKQNKQKKEKKAKKNLLSFGDDEDEDEDV